MVTQESEQSITITAPTGALLSSETRQRSQRQSTPALAAPSAHYGTARNNRRQLGCPTI